MSDETDLNKAQSPEDVPHILRNAADYYRMSIGDLQSQWQDKNAGRVWGRLAAKLEHTARVIEEELKKGHY